jgi:hypothetical protein
MKSVMTLNTLEIQQLNGSCIRVDDQTRNWWLTKENACLMADNARLRTRLKDLEDSSHMWIRLYSAALDRANAATQAVRAAQSMSHE